MKRCRKTTFFGSRTQCIPSTAIDEVQFPIDRPLSRQISILLNRPKAKEEICTYQPRVLSETGRKVLTLELLGQIQRHDFRDKARTSWNF